MVFLTPCVAVSADTDSSGQTVRVVASLPGLAEPKQQVSLSVPVDGVLADVLVADGDQVEPNTILAQLDSRALQQELYAAEVRSSSMGSVLKATHALEFAERNLTRFQGMRKSAAVSDKSYDEAKTSHDIAVANLQIANEAADTATTQCEILRTAIEVRNIRAPFAGRVLRVVAQPGQSVAMAQTIITLANLDEMIVDLHLPISIYREMQIGNQYNLAADIRGHEIVAAKLISIEPVVNAATQSFRCRFAFDNRETRFPAGFSVKLVRPEGNSQWATLPTERISIP